jgi:hypothetical protein
MSLSKRILFGNDPADDGARAKLHEKTRQVVELFTFKIPPRRRNRLKYGAYWDSIWPGCVCRAADELGLEYVTINSSVCLKTKAEADSVIARAEVLYRERADSASKMAAQIESRMRGS